MKKITLGAAAIFACLLMCCTSCSNNVEIKYSEKVLRSTPDSIREVFQDVAEDYFDFLGCHESLIVRDTVIEESTINEATGESWLILALGRSGEILINIAYFGKKNITKRNARDIFNHEMGHTRRPKYGTWIYTPDGYVLYCQGLVVFTTNLESLSDTNYFKKENITGRYTGIEEGSAEITAKSVYRDYEIGSCYFNITNIVQAMVKKQFFGISYLAKAAQTNDALGIVARALNKKKDDVTGKELVTVLKIFSAVQNTQTSRTKKDEYQDGFNAIMQLRQ